MPDRMMSQGAGISKQAISPASEGESLSDRKGAWAVLKRGAHQSVFWTYERGSWQYDVICTLILAFIFLTPPSLFHDNPTLGLSNLRHIQGIIELGRGRDGRHYLIDSRLVASLAPLQPDAAIRQILQKRLREPVRLKSVTILFDKNNVILGYTVVVARK